jgi:2-oxoglutarate dehydrogenase E2 component (dihydrolipoamide succinyltransferase)
VQVSEPNEVEQLEVSITNIQEDVNVVDSNDNRFYSPLVRNIAKKEGVTQAQLDSIQGSGKDGRVTKKDILAYISHRSVDSTEKSQDQKPLFETRSQTVSIVNSLTSSGEDEIIEMSRMGKLVSKHMTDSLQTSAHVQSFIEVDVTKIWNWRKKIKESFMAREGENITFTPIFMEAIAYALSVHPMLNISIQDGKIIKRKNINIGMATSLDDGNLIVPVIKNADQLNLVGMTKRVNDLAQRARTNQLKPDDIQDGTYTVTNVGGFGSIMGTPIINQPQVGILALGAIRKVPAVIETSEGDFIGIREKMFLSHSYDHRVVNGALGGQFLKTVKDYLEAWDDKRIL